MARYVFALGVLAAIAATGQPASASVYSDDLGKCLVAHTSNDDRVLLIQWMFVAFSAHPAVRPLASVTPEQKEEFDKKVAALFVRLMTDSCHKEALDALKYDGAPAVGVAFQLLGQVAARDLMTQHDVAAAMGNLGKYLDNDEGLKALLRDAGVAEKPQK